MRAAALRALHAARTARHALFAPCASSLVLTSKLRLQEAMAEANRKRIGTAFKAMSHGNKDFNTCNEYKDGGLAPDDPFHKIKTEKFGTPFTPSSPAKSVRRRRRRRWRCSTSLRLLRGCA